MWCIIESPAGTEVSRHKLADTDILDCETYAQAYADKCGLELDLSEGFIPNCCGDVRVEFREDPENSVHIWTGQSFYFKNE